MRAFWQNFQENLDRTRQLLPSCLEIRREIISDGARNATGTMHVM